MRPPTPTTTITTTEAMTAITARADAARQQRAVASAAKRQPQRPALDRDYDMAVSACGLLSHIAAGGAREDMIDALAIAAGKPVCGREMLTRWLPCLVRHCDGALKLPVRRA